MLDALENVGQLTGANLMMLKERDKPAASRCAGGAGDGLYGATNACEGRGSTVCVGYEAGERCRF